MCIRSAMTYSFPVFAAPKVLVILQVMRNKFCRDTTNAQWCVKNSILNRDLQLPTASTVKMKDSSKRIFNIAKSHPNALLRSAAFYEPPVRYHFVRRLRNVLTDSYDALTAAVENVTEVNNTNV
ncbi:hypothetical protein EVAR_78105_1 [Eumeta japonica]|uniref:Uncharacterized protein n=1 Tax=Eumeta variegata TaxID=151549 RepID=A0A4C1T0J2_EUMVA|nr:hypothetical protein EVAR_78105_1 [Eumeta japonica]